MATLRSRCGQYIFALWFLSIFLFFIPRLISAVGDWMPTILRHMVWPWCEFRMQVWHVLHAARCKCRTQKGHPKSPSGHHRTTLSGYIFATKAHIDNRKKNLLSSNVSSTCPPKFVYLRPTSGWDLLASLGHPCKFQWVSHLGSVTARHSSSGRQPNFAALNRGHHLYSAWRPSRWALTHISSLHLVSSILCQEVGWEEHLRNDLFCVKWDVKTLTQSINLNYVLLNCFDSCRREQCR